MRKSRVEVLETSTKKDEKTGREVPQEPKRLAVFHVNGFSLEDLRAKAVAGSKRFIGSRVPSINFGDKDGSSIYVCVARLKR